MLARVYSSAVVGLDGVTVEVEVDIANGLPGMSIVGFPDAAMIPDLEVIPVSTLVAATVK